MKIAVNGKTYKQLCVEMWEWLAAHPECGKLDYRQYLSNNNKEEEYSMCWACKYDRGLTNTCCSCPVKWPEGDCCSDESPYTAWSKIDDDRFEGLKYDLDEQRANAKAVLKLVQETWTEESEAQGTAYKHYDAVRPGGMV